ncbi:sugar transferase, partial [Candidatus Omnitrophota bacterium]
RTTKRIILRALIKRGLLNFNTLIIGAGNVGRTLFSEIMLRPFLGMKVLGFLDDKLNTAFLYDSLPILGKLNEFEKICKRLFIDEIFITLPSERKRISEILNQANKLHVGVRIVPDNFELSTRQLHLNHIGFLPVLTYQERRLIACECTMKRVFDMLVSLTLIILLFPLFILLSILIKLDSRGTVFFIQKRMGKRGKVFNLYKFRSMVRGADRLKRALVERNEAKGGVIFKIRDDPRITKIGRILRRFSLDELPQLFNVLKGDMSLVGSRPFPVEESEKFNHEHMKRLNIKPGLTGMAQIRGRSDLSFYRWVKWDSWYIDNWSFGLDLKILFWTIMVVIKKQGAY